MYNKIKTNDATLNKVQDNVDIAMREMMLRPLAGATIAKDISLTTSNTEIIHGLSGPPIGWVVTKADAGVSIYSDTPHANPNKFIYIKSTAPVTASLLFF